MQPQFDSTDSEPDFESAETILVVDDHECLCEVAARILQMHGYRVLTATSGEEAIRIASENRPIDLLFTDLEMPGMRGDELADCFQLAHPDTAVMFTSGSPEELRSLDSRHFVEKPYICLQAMVKKVREVLNDRKTCRRSEAVAA